MVLEKISIFPIVEIFVIYLVSLGVVTELLLETVCRDGNLMQTIMGVITVLIVTMVEEKVKKLDFDSGEEVASVAFVLVLGIKDWELSSDSEIDG